MDYFECIRHWLYFCSLAELFDETKKYVYHGLVLDDETGTMCFAEGTVYSDRFKQIILLASAEFETVGKCLAGIEGSCKTNIAQISSTILSKYPKIVDFELITPFGVGFPLKQWRIVNKQVLGLEWWKSYNSLKHNNRDSFIEASLENACLALASLYILNLYLIYSSFGSLRIANDNPNVYFKCKYLPEYVFAGEGKLPDYGNASPLEAIKAKYPEIFHIAGTASDA